MNKPNRQLAVALAYRSGDTAPKVVASGRGLIAQAIIERAKEHGVFVHESEELVAMLMQVELDQHIPPDQGFGGIWPQRIGRGAPSQVPQRQQAQYEQHRSRQPVHPQAMQSVVQARRRGTGHQKCRARSIPA